MTYFLLRRMRIVSFLLLSLTFYAFPVVAFDHSNDPNISINDQSVVTKENVASWIEIASPENEGVVDPMAPLLVGIEYEAWHFDFSIKDEQKTVSPASFDAIELLLDGEPIALRLLTANNKKAGSVSFEISPGDLPDDAQQIMLQARAYSVYLPLDNLPTPFKGNATKHANKVAAESEVIIVTMQKPTPRAQLERTLEKYSPLDPQGDEDGDGLLNSFEIYNMQLTTLPDDSDSDGNGTDDAKEDIDNDGLTNLQEQTHGTNPIAADTDRDGLTDKEEIDIYSTDPNNPDTDNDGLFDGLEIELGTDPHNPDTDSDGVFDGDDSIEFEVTDKDTGISVNVIGIGTIKHNLSFLLLNNEPAFAEATAFITAVEITIGNNELIDEAIVTIPFDPTMLGDTDPVDLGIAYINVETGEMEPLAEQVVDMINNTVSGITTHFSTFVLYDVAKMTEIFAGEFFGSVRSGGGSIVLVFSIDSSGSMSSNDPNNIRKSVSKDLIDSLEDDDKVGVVDLDSSAHILQEITTDKEAAKRAVDQINSSGGTNIGAAVTTANSMLINETENLNKIQILLTDGQGSYDLSYTQQAVDNDIIIYTIGLGSGVDENLLSSIAEQTGGAYFQVNQADDLVSVFQTLKEETNDTDGDGLSDSAEINGMRTIFGTIITSDPNNSDTDNDGLTDGKEMGIVLTDFRGRYYLVLSNPNVIDTDGDGLSDADEVENGTFAFLQDSDSDGLSDFVDSYPTRWDFYGRYRKGDIILGGHSTEVEDGWNFTNRYAMSTWSHAGIYMGDEKVLDSHPDNPNKGVDWSNIEEFLTPEDGNGKGYYRFSALRVKDKDDDSAGRAGDKAYEYYGKPFGLEFDDALFGLGLYAGDVYCAELVQRGWVSEGVVFNSIFTIRRGFFVRPKDIHNSTKTDELHFREN